MLMLALSNILGNCTLPIDMHLELQVVMKLSIVICQPQPQQILSDCILTYLVNLCFQCTALVSFSLSIGLGLQMRRLLHPSKRSIHQTNRNSKSSRSRLQCYQSLTVFRHPTAHMVLPYCLLKRRMAGYVCAPIIEHLTNRLLQTHIRCHVQMNFQLGCVGHATLVSQICVTDITRFRQQRKISTKQPLLVDTVPMSSRFSSLAYVMLQAPSNIL